MSNEALRDAARLAEAARDGDSTAFEELVQRYQRLVFKIAFHKCGDRAEAEDITQEIFLHAYRSLPRLQEPQAFLGWLLAIAHNRANRYCRALRSRRNTLEEARRRAETEPEIRAPGLEEEDAVAGLFEELGDDYRRALTWKYLDGLSYEEIGERLQLSFNQVDYLLRRAKKALRRIAKRRRSPVTGKTAKDGS